MHRNNARKSSAIPLAAALLLAAAQGRADGFGAASVWNDWFGIGDESQAVGDFNGDGRDDVVTFVRSTRSGAAQGDVFVALAKADGDGFEPGEKWHDWFGIGDEVQVVGDFDGDDKDDIATFIRDTQAGAARGDVYVALSTGSGFGPGRLWSGWLGILDQIPAAGDFDRDGDDDIAIFVRDSDPNRRGDVLVSLSNRRSFGTARKWHDWFSIGAEIPAVGDFNGDRRDDIVTFVRSSKSGSAKGDVYVALSTGSGFAAGRRWHDWFAPGGALPAVGDFDGDGRDDIASFVRSSSGGAARGDVVVALADPYDLVFGEARVWHDWFALGAEVPAVGRFDADEKDDIAAFVRSARSDESEGDVWVALTDALSVVEPSVRSDDFGFDSMRVNGHEASGVRPLLLVVARAPWMGSMANPTSFYEDRVFGSSFPNVVDYFDTVSGGRFTWSRAGGYAIDFRDPPVDSKFDARTEQGSIREVIVRVDELGFDFADYDEDGNGVVQTHELGVIVFDNKTRFGAAHRSACQNAPRSGVRVCVQVALIGEEASFAHAAHELSHSLGAHDLYGDGCRSGGLTLMSCTGSATPNSTRTHDLDPWHAMVLGWRRPQVVSILQPGLCTGVLTNRNPVLLYDPRRGTREYFLLEWREPGLELSYDRDHDGSGLAVWHVQTDAYHEPLIIPSDDGEGRDRAVFTLGAPFGARGGKRLWSDGVGTFRIAWADGSDTRLRLRVASANEEDSIGGLEWGLDALPAPRIQYLTPSFASPGQEVWLTGRLGVDERDRPVTLRAEGLPEYRAEVLEWSCGRTRVRLPNSMPEARYEMRVYESPAARAAGNGAMIEVR